jgi:hypothetical protein
MGIMHDSVTASKVITRADTQPLSQPVIGVIHHTVWWCYRLEELLAAGCDAVHVPLPTGVTDQAMLAKAVAEGPVRPHHVLDSFADILRVKGHPALAASAGS